MSTTAKKLDKKGVAILVINLILSFIFILSGIMVASDDYDDDDDYYGGSSSSSLTLNSTTVKYTSSYNYYSFTFYPTSSQYYNIYIDDGEVISVTDSYGYTKTLYGESSYSWDEAYEVYLSSYTTYTIRVYAKSSSITILIAD